MTSVVKTFLVSKIMQFLKGTKISSNLLLNSKTSMGTPQFFVVNYKTFFKLFAEKK